MKRFLISIVVAWLLIAAPLAEARSQSIPAVFGGCTLSGSPLSCTPTSSSQPFAPVYLRIEGGINDISTGANAATVRPTSIAMLSLTGIISKIWNCNIGWNDPLSWCWNPPAGVE